MSFIKFIHNHINDINNYVQAPTLWRDGRFANLAEKVEATNGDFAEVVRNLPAALSREDIIGKHPIIVRTFEVCRHIFAIISKRCKFACLKISKR